MKTLEKRFSSLYCPNCGIRLMGYATEEVILKIQCSKCKVIIVSSKKPKRREINIRVINTT